MGWTKLDFIKSGYEEIGLADYVFDLQAEDISSALLRLDSMMAEWDVRGIRVGYPLTSSPNDSASDTEFDVPLFATGAIIYNIAVLLGAKEGKIVSPATKKAAKEGLDNLYLQCVHIPVQQQPRRMPIGAGNRRYRFFQGRFFRPIETTPPSEQNITIDDV
jgi:hypothetical protein